MTNPQIENLLLPDPDSIADLTDSEREKVRLITEFLQGWITKDSEHIISLLTPDAVFHEQFLPEPYQGHDEFRQFLQEFFPVVSHLGYKVEEWVIQGDRIAIRGIFSGTFTGEFMGMDAAGKSFSVPFSEFVTFKDAKIAYVWEQTDGLQLAQQIGGF